MLRWVLGSLLCVAACSEPGPAEVQPLRTQAPEVVSQPAGPNAEPAEPSELSEPSAKPPNTPAQLPELKVEMKTTTTWAPVKTWPGALSSASALPVRVALGPDGKPAVAGDPQAIAAKMTRGFQLPQAQLFLGEPLVVALRIELAQGAAEWGEDMGGNYRGRGRDDNFAFALERPDGSYVPDIFQGPVYIGGGLGAAVQVSAAKPFMHHIAVQHYAEILDAGSYKLHCVFFARGHSPAGFDEARGAHAIAQLGPGTTYDAATNIATSPGGKAHSVIPSLGEDFGTGPIALPKAMLDRLGKNTAQITDYAVFEIEVREGSNAQRKAMVRRWAKLAQGARDMAWPRALEDAAREAISYARQDDFLPTLKLWLEAKPGAGMGLLQGIAMRDSPAAVQLVLDHGRSASWYGLRDLSDTAVRGHAEAVVALLDDEDARTRAEVFAVLSRVAKERFGAAWSGYDSARPTRAEATAMLPAVRAHFGLRAP